MKEEHLVLKPDGTLVGLNVIDPHKARKLHRFWDGVSEIVRSYALVHPEEVQLTTIENRVTRSGNNNKFGANKSGTMRHCLSLPFALMNVLEEYEPTLFTNQKTRHEFMRRFPVFTTCQSI